jgi:hypothetical protein
MASSESIDGIEFFRDTDGPDLYYGQYRYKFCTRLIGVHYARSAPTVVDFEFRIHNSRNWFTISATRTIAEELLDDGANIDFLHKFVQWRKLVKESSEPVKLVLSHNCVTLYTNSMSFINSCLENSFLRVGLISCHYRERVGNFDKNTVYHVNPKFEHRLYFKYTVFDIELAKNFIDFVHGHGMIFNPRVRGIIKNGLKSRVQWNYGIRPKQIEIYNNDYIEFNDNSLITVFALKYPHMVRKICEIRAKYQ